MPYSNMDFTNVQRDWPRTFMLLIVHCQDSFWHKPSTEPEQTWTVDGSWCRPAERLREGDGSAPRSILVSPAAAAGVRGGRRWESRKGGRWGTAWWLPRKWQEWLPTAWQCGVSEHTCSQPPTYPPFAVACCCARPGLYKRKQVKGGKGGLGREGGARREGEGGEKESERARGAWRKGQGGC